MGIEISGRLIRDDERWPMNQGARNSGPLLFAAAELMNEMAASLLQSHQLDQLVRAPVAFVGRHALQKQRERHILAHIHRWHQVEELENEPDLPAPELG